MPLASGSTTPSANDTATAASTDVAAAAQHLESGGGRHGMRARHGGAAGRALTQRGPLAEHAVDHALQLVVAPRRQRAWSVRLAKRPPARTSRARRPRTSPRSRARSSRYQTRSNASALRRARSVTAGAATAVSAAGGAGAATSHSRPARANGRRPRGRRGGRDRRCSPRRPAGSSASASVAPSALHAGAAWRAATRLTYAPSSGVTSTAPRPVLAVNASRSPEGAHAGCSAPDRSRSPCRGRTPASAPATAAPVRRP